MICEIPTQTNKGQASKRAGRPDGPTRPNSISFSERAGQDFCRASLALPDIFSFVLLFYEISCIS
jgi:hypothetical protein